MKPLSGEAIYRAWKEAGKPLTMEQFAAIVRQIEVQHGIRSAGVDAPTTPESEVARLRAALEWITENGPDDGWELRQKAREALGPEDDVPTTFQGTSRFFTKPD